MKKIIFLFYLFYSLIGFSQNDQLAQNYFDKGEFEKITTVDVLRGKWTDVVVHFRPTKENGILEIYVNGKLERTVDNPMLISAGDDPKTLIVKFNAKYFFYTKWGRTIQQDELRK